MRLLEDGLINRNCHDMPAVIPKMLNLFKMEIRASTVALAFPDIYPWLSLNWSWNILTGSIRRKNPSNQTLGHSGRSASRNPPSISGSHNTYTIRQIINVYICFIRRAFKQTSSLKCCRFSQVPASETGLNQASDATSHLHILVDMFFLHVHETPQRHCLNVRPFFLTVHHSLWGKKLLREV